MTNIDPAIVEACALPAGSRPTLAEAVARLIDAARAEGDKQGAARVREAVERTRKAMQAARVRADEDGDTVLYEAYTMAVATLSHALALTEAAPRD